MQGKILVVDDEEFCHAAMKSLCQKKKISLCNIDFCFDGLEAMKLIKSGQNYQIIFLDFNMPKLNGPKTTVAIRSFMEKVLKIQRDH